MTCSGTVRALVSEFGQTHRFEGWSFKYFNDLYWPLRKQCPKLMLVTVCVHSVDVFPYLGGHGNNIEPQAKLDHVSTSALHEH